MRCSAVDFVVGGEQTTGRIHGFEESIVSTKVAFGSDDSVSQSKKLSFARTKPPVDD